ncbi:MULTISPECIES: SurA N-terminal domain-containing protein [Hyphomonas]|uniref:Parvulin-like PPIase n=1 Tax=Hyphomonas adhaerens TaxID=81029 RepID=A0A3B9H1X2_9PROT|nr:MULTISPECIES: SurA N-terminal domain-containing protein [Hyphomonas]MBB41727.1 peptidylprolyl isomerase [Hyphomonas sp.]HAE28693.1 peptidylprolyl isomerase [Hyphomonas adhaerens]|tara:strand:- start:475 stop:1722 length:1248 start_codon:yes stop_codon:yes gene_type:complete
MVRKLVAAAVFLALPFAGIANAQDAAPDDGSLTLEGVAAVVNDQPISFTDVRDRARMLLLSLGGQQPSQEQVQQITGQALEQLIDEHLQLDKAAEFDLEISKEEIDGAVEGMAAQSGLTGADLKSQLLAAGIDPSSLEEQMRAEIAWNRVMSGLYGSRIRISDNQVDDEIEQIRSATKKTQYRISEIFLFAPDAETRTQAEEAARSILEQLKAGADFRVAAQRLSSAPTAATGGDMGWVSLADVSPDLAPAIEAASGPGLLEPIVVDNGVYILFIQNKREPAEATTKVDLIRLITRDATDENLKAAMDRITSCDDVQSVANTTQGLRAQPLDDINVDELGPEGKSLVENAEIGQPTDIFAVSGGLGTMYVCRREEGAEAIPSRDDLKNNLKGRELNMISERELRNLRRDATIIYR